MTSAALHLLDADRPQPRRSPGARDSARLQDRPSPVRVDGTRVDPQVRHLDLPNPEGKRGCDGRLVTVVALHGRPTWSAVYDRRVMGREDHRDY